MLGFITKSGVSWPSGLVHWICVLMAESSECGFEPWPLPWLHTHWARHFTIIASLHPGVNGYLWRQSWLLCLISPICAEMAAIELYSYLQVWSLICKSVTMFIVCCSAKDVRNTQVLRMMLSWPTLPSTDIIAMQEIKSGRRWNS